jgi:uncharacterized membrane protein YdjX (TVP38/TMEM64 family)
MQSNYNYLIMKQLHSVHQGIRRIQHHSRKAKKVIRRHLKTQQARLQQTQRDIHVTFIRHRIFIMILIIMIAFLLIDYFQNGFTYSLFAHDATSTIHELEQYGSFGMVVYVLLVGVETIIAPLPSFMLYAAGGILFGNMLGTILTILGNIFGATACFFLARYFLKQYIEQKIPGQILKQFNKYSEKYGAFAIFFLRINPITSFDIINYVAGISKIRFIPFILSTICALVPLAFLQVYFGSDIIGKSSFFTFLFVTVFIVYFAVFCYVLFRKKVNIKKIEPRK